MAEPSKFVTVTLTVGIERERIVCACCGRLATEDGLFVSHVQRYQGERVDNVGFSLPDGWSEEHVHRHRHVSGVSGGYTTSTAAKFCAKCTAERDRAFGRQP